MRTDKKTAARKAKPQAFGPRLREESAVANEVGAYEARTHFSALLARVQRGERVTITKHGQPIAMLVPAAEGAKRPIAEVIEEFKRLRKGVRLDGLTIRELREEGRE